MTLLTLIQDVADEIGIARPSIVIGATDPGVRQLLTLANREGRELMKAVEWPELQRLHSFTTTASTAEYSLPSDYDRIVIDTEWDEDQSWPLHGPVSMQGWQVLKASVLGAGLVGKRYRIYRSASSTSRVVYLDPTPGTTGETLSYFYISENWCASSGGTGQSAWAADDDTLLLDSSDLYKLGVVIRLKRAKGLMFASEADEYDQLLTRAKTQARPARTISLAQRRRHYLLGRDNVPETGIGG